jgi:RimJ/RimL family protein N-acetyltransferase
MIRMTRTRSSTTAGRTPRSLASVQAIDPLGPRIGLILREFDALQRLPPHQAFAEVPEYGLTLHPLRHADVDDAGLIAAISTWRDRHMWVFPTQFPVTEAGTRGWLVDMLARPDRVLLFVRQGDRPVGHLGLTNALNPEGIALSAVMVGERDAMPSGAMFACELKLFEWAYGTLHTPRIHAPVAADNLPSVSLLHKLGFTPARTTSLRRHELPGGRIEFRPRERGDTAPADREWHWQVHWPTAAHRSFRLKNGSSTNW